MKHLFLFLTIFSLGMITAADAQTQSSWRLGFGIDGGVATKDPFKYTLGGDIRLQKDFSDKISGTLTAGFVHFFEKDHFDGYNQYGSPYNVIPVKAGIKYFVANNLYLGGEAGVGFGFEQWGNSFLWSPSVGLAFKNGIDISIKYEDYTANKITKDVALRLAYGFGTRSLTVHKRTTESNDLELGFAIMPGATTVSFDQASLGAEATLYKRVAGNLQLTLTAGYTHNFEPTNYYIANPNGFISGTSYSNRNIIPVKAGLKLYAGDRFFVAGEAGVAFAGHGITSFVYSPSIGLTLKNNWDIGVKYENYSSSAITDVMALKLGHRFKL